MGTSQSQVNCSLNAEINWIMGVVPIEWLQKSEVNLMEDVWNNRLGGKHGWWHGKMNSSYAETD